METVTVNGKEVPVSELVAAFTALPAVRNELSEVQRAQEAAVRQIEETARQVQFVEKMQSDPSFARKVVDHLAEIHHESAYMNDLTGNPNANTGEQDQDTGDITGRGVKVSDLTDRRIEDLNRQIAEMKSKTQLDEVLQVVKQQYPEVDPQALLKRALESDLPLSHLPTMAAAIDRDRLAGRLEEQGRNKTFLSEMLGDGGVDQGDLSLLGSSLTTAELDPGANIDYGTLEIGDAILLAAQKVGLDAGPMV